MTADRLHAALGALPVRIERVRCRSGTTTLASYPGGRPTSVVTMDGGGVSGNGEHVGWATDDHAAFRVAVDAFPCGTGTLAAWSETIRQHVATAYDRAALETAAAALALAQAGTTLAALARRHARPPRIVRSLAPGPEPWAALDAVAGHELKIDAHPDWSAATWRALSTRARIAVVDFKGAGTPAAVRAAHEALPAALLEDPPADAVDTALAAHVGHDAAVTDVDALRALHRPRAINVKVPRMGGLLPALAAVAWCEARDVAVYLGGMWETGPGRALSQTLAGLLAPRGPNDVADLVRRA